MFTKLINKYFFILLFVALSIFPIASLFHPGFPITHDGQDHVARIANFYQNLIEGNLIPRWAANLNWGYGHPILEFLYPFPSYISSFFHFFGLSLVDSTKIVFGLGIDLSLLFMYLWLSQFLSKYSALFGAVLFTYAPYRFVDLYVRGDIGENLAFAFIPLTLFFIYKTYKKQSANYVILGGVSLALLILSHNAISLISVPFIFIYSLVLIYLSKNRKSLIINHLSLIIIGFLLSAFFWIPALIEGKYTLRNILTVGTYINRFVNFQSLIYGPWSYGQTGQFTVQLGPFQWLALLASPFTIYFFKKNKGLMYLGVILLVCSLISIFLMLPISNFIWKRIILLQNFQFPWRFLALSVFTTAVLGALLIETLSKKFGERTSTILTIMAILIILIISSVYAKPKGYQYKPESFYTGIYYSTTDTGESSPIWSVRFMEHIPKSPAEIIEGNGEIKETLHKSTYRVFEFDSENNARVLINILYFPNWIVYVDGKEKITQFQDPRYRGLMTFEVAAGQHKIEAVYKSTKLRAFSDAISVVVLFNILGFVGFRFVKRYFS